MSQHFLLMDFNLSGIFGKKKRIFRKPACFRQESWKILVYFDLKNQVWRSPCAAGNRKDAENMQKAINIQDSFLSLARKEKLPLTLFLMNGFQMRGVVTGYDQFTVVLECEGKQELVYKHAISTIIPVRPAELIMEG